MIKSIITLLRPHQYIKNFFIFLPLFFGLKGFNSYLICQLVVAFIAFSLVASAVYIFNDSIDIKRDRAHPIKKHRPLASGKFSIKGASVLGIGLVCFGLGIAYIQSVWIPFLLYIFQFLLVNNQLYTSYHTD